MRYFPIMFCLLVTTACGEAPTPTATPTPDSSTDSTGELQGTWRSLDDDRATLRFEGNLMISSYSGEEDEGEHFVIARSCADAPEDAPTEQGKYLIVPDAARCYYILRLTENELDMSYVGRGNTLRYVRVEDSF